MAEEKDLQEEIKKIAEAIKALENLRGKIPEEQLEESLTAYQKKLQILVSRLKTTGGSAGVKPQRRTESSLPSTGRNPVTMVTLRDAYEVYLKPKGEPQLSEDEFKGFLGEYLDWVHKAYGFMHLFGLETLHAEGGKLQRPIPELYITPTMNQWGEDQREALSQQLRGKSSKLARTKTHHEAIEKLKSQGEAVSVSAMLSSEWIDQNPWTGIIGPSGSGKSTLLAYFASNLVQNAQTGKLLPFALPDEVNTLIPVIIPIRQYWRYLQWVEEEAEERRVRKAKQAEAKKNEEKNQVSPGENAYEVEEQENEKDEELSSSLAAFMIWYLKQRTSKLRLSQDFFSRLIGGGGGCLLMFDGVDDLTKEEQRMDIRRQILDAIKVHYKDNIVFATARDFGSTDYTVLGSEFNFVFLQVFDENQVSQLVMNWCKQFNPRKTGSLHRDIMLVIEDINEYCTHRRLPPLVESALMASLFISLRLGAAENWPPVDKNVLFDSLLMTMIKSSLIPDDPERKQVLNWGGEWQEILEWLTELAFEIHKGGAENKALPENQLRDIAQAIIPEEQINSFIHATRYQGSLLTESSEMFEFSHPMIQMYLAARVITQKRNEVMDDLEYHIAKPWWRETLLLVYTFSLKENAVFANEYLNWLSEFQLPGLELAGAALLNANNYDIEERRKRAQALAESLEDKTAGALPPQRALAGYTLSSLGDPRFNKDAWFLPADPMLGFVKIPEGSYMIGSNPERDREANTKEVPLHEIGTLTFYIARYPVTTAQFRVFVEETNYPMLEKECLSEPANHPITQVTWDDAIAYCKWLERKLMHWNDTPEELVELLKTNDWQLTLPSEAEWEAAARGTNRRMFPWGSKFDPKNANTSETHLGRTTAVGIFPGGESPYHVLDLSGNVWEWTRSLYRIYYYNSGDGREDHHSRDFRVLRGGSFLNSRTFARCPYRNMYYPDYKSNNIGFRIAIFQKYEYEEKEIEVEVPLEEGEESPDGKDTKIEIQKIMIRKRVVVAGPRQDR